MRNYGTWVDMIGLGVGGTVRGSSEDEEGGKK